MNSKVKFVKNFIMSKILVIGSSGQIGIDLVLELRRRKGVNNVIATDIKEPCPILINDGPFYQLDVLDKEKLEWLIQEENITEVYLLAALLSAIAEQKPQARMEIEYGWIIKYSGTGKTKN